MEETMTKQTRKALDKHRHARPKAARRSWDPRIRELTDTEICKLFGDLRKQVVRISNQI